MYIGSIGTGTVSTELLILTMPIPQPIKKKRARKKKPTSKPGDEPLVGELVPCIPQFEPRLLYLPSQPAPLPPGVKYHRNTPFVPTAWQRGVVAMGKAAGLSDKMIASNIINPATDAPISVDSLNKYFHDDLENGLEKVTFNLSAKLYHSAIYLDDTRAAMYLLNTRAGWREQREEPPVPGGARAALVVPGVASIEDWEKISAQHRAFIDEQQQMQLSPPTEEQT